MADTLTILDLLNRTTDFFTTKGVPNPRLDAELLIAHGLGLKRLELYTRFDTVLTEAQLSALRPLVARRARREPLQYIIGSVDWATLKLSVDSRVLIPRHETEELWDKIVISYKEKTPPATILDLGTGSGALALALKKSFPAATVTATDASADALEVARANATRLALDIYFLHGSWFAPIAAPTQFDLIVSNPPYLTSAEVAAAQPEVRTHEPACALSAPDDGFADIATIITAAHPHLSLGGTLWLETGINHGPQICALATSLSYTSCDIFPDLTGRPRFAKLSR